MGFDAVLTGLFDLFEPLRLAMLIAGVLLGLIIGVIPGIGGVFGLTILIPLTYSLDPVSAFALLLGMASVTTTSDTIPAVLLGIPGTVGAAATVVDGHALAQKNQAARAFGAAYSASLIGGVFGALVLALVLPVMRPLVLALDFGDLLGITIFGLTLATLVSGASPARGLVAATAGALIGYTGLDPYEGAERWTMGQVWLWDGFPTGIVFLGLFGLPELAAVLARGQIQQSAARLEKGGLRRGIGDTIRNWPLVLRSSTIGTLLGAIPGVGVVIIEWIAYGDAARNRKGDTPFGEGNIRGVIAPESANNSKEGGSLIPTLAFGIPGSATMALLTGAFLIQGIVPGPKMLEDHAPLLWSMVFTIALANVMGALICLGLTPQLARVARVQASTLVPVALAFMLIGAYQTTKTPADLGVLIGFGLLGIIMKRAGWSRPAFVLGLVLAPSLERYYVLTTQISGWTWVTQPFVLVLLALSAALVLRHTTAWRKRRIESVPEAAGRDGDLAFLALTTVFFATILALALSLPGTAGTFPSIMAVVGLIALIIPVVAALRRTEGLRLPLGQGAGSILAASVLGSALILGFGHLLGLALLLIAVRLHLRAPSWPVTVVSVMVLLAVVWTVFDLISPQHWPEPWVMMSW